MAVYTKLTQSNIKNILLDYSIGELEKFEGIEEGIENSNFLIIVNKKKYILTVYEKRVKKKDLPFFSELMMVLEKSGFKSPKPITNKKNKLAKERDSKAVKDFFAAFPDAKLIDVTEDDDA